MPRSEFTTWVTTWTFSVVVKSISNVLQVPTSAQREPNGFAPRDIHRILSSPVWALSVFCAPPTYRPPTPIRQGECHTGSPLPAARPPSILAARRPSHGCSERTPATHPLRHQLSSIPFVAFVEFARKIVPCRDLQDLLAKILPHFSERCFGSVPVGLPASDPILHQRKDRKFPTLPRIFHYPTTRAGWSGPTSGGNR